ncbi:MAG: hypothetical protein J6X18_01235 [Bacteroidales bacterium]|nr:hypothetical protein [Bacteroidales bacterium]
MVREEICKRWKSLGFTDTLSGKNIEKMMELFKSEAKELPIEPDPNEQHNLPIIRVIEPFENKEKGEE